MQFFSSFSFFFRGGGGPPPIPFSPSRVQKREHALPVSSRMLCTHADVCKLYIYIIYPIVTSCTHLKALEQAGGWLEVNGEAIYSTRAMPLHWNDTASSFVRYTRSKDNSTVYAMALTGFGGPQKLPDTIKLACVMPKPGSTITMLGEAAPVKWTTVGSGGGGVILTLPSQPTLGPGVAFKITGKPAESC